MKPIKRANQTTIAYELQSLKQRQDIGKRVSQMLSARHRQPRDQRVKKTIERYEKQYEIELPQLTIEMINWIILQTQAQLRMSIFL